MRFLHNYGSIQYYNVIHSINIFFEVNNYKCVHQVEFTVVVNQSNIYHVLLPKQNKTVLFINIKELVVYLSKN